MLRIDADRLWTRLHDLGRIGADPAGGVTRLAYSPQWQAGRQWLRQQMESLNMAVRLDPAGNLIGTYPGLQSDLPPLATGSHTDTVVQGGTFDGALGVVAGLACAEALHTAGRRLQRNLEVIDFACEEATYAGGTLGSLAMAGNWDDALLREPGAGTGSLADLLRAAGIDPAGVSLAARRKGSLAAYLELHIEQGGVLEAEGIPVGVVEGIVGIRRFRLSFPGRANHAGTTPMRLRDDALVKASSFVVRVQEEAVRQGERCVATVGQLEVFPGSPNVVPGRVDLTMEIRAQAESDLDALESRLRVHAPSATWTTVLLKPPVDCDQTLVRSLEEACLSSRIAHRRMVSGAGHDAMCMPAVAPTAMIFVPSRAGISHAPDEWTEKEQCALGAQLLLDALILLDDRRAAPGPSW